MFFARFNINGRETAQLYYSLEEYHADTFSPETRFIDIVDFSIHGKDYQSRKQSLYDTAVKWSYCDTSGLYMSELAEVSDWFYRNGKRYGLLREFLENAIC